MQKITIVCRMLNSLFLLSILVVSLLILRDMPAPFPRKDDITIATKRRDVKLLKQLSERVPLVSLSESVSLEEPVTISGSVSIDGPVSIDSIDQIEPFRPLEVKIKEIDYSAKPIPVEIEPSR